MFCVSLDNVIGRSNEQISSLNFLLDSRLLYESLELLNDFLSFWFQSYAKNTIISIIP